VGFEKAMWREHMVKRYGFPPIPDDRWHDIMAVCALKQVPLKLEHALTVFSLPPKDVAASRFTKMLSKPITRGKRKGEFDRRPQSLERVYAYNRDDIRVETALHKRMGYLPPAERPVWLLDQTINERGVRVDLPYV
jgi:DNA polymerase